MRGIYKITNKTNNKIYIGESLDIIRRWSEHIENLNNGTHHSYKLQKDWDIYGEDDFVFEIVSVLDDSIETYIDRYILLIYEYKYMSKYNSLESGYNVEKTLYEVMSGNKIINNTTRDKALIDSYIKKIKDNIIKEKGGIIYTSIFTIKNVLNALKLDDINKLKGILYNYNFTIKKGSAYVLDENIFNKDDIICNDRFSKIKINENIYFKLVNEINKIIELGDVKYAIEKKVKVKKEAIKKEEIYKEVINNVEKEKTPNKTNNNNKPTIPNTMKDFLSNYMVNVKYNQVYEFLRNKNVLKYIDFNGKKANYPTSEYMDCFIIEEAGENKKYLRLLFTDKGKSIIRDILISGSIISLV